MLTTNLHADTVDNVSNLNKRVPDEIQDINLLGVEQNTIHCGEC